MAKLKYWDNGSWNELSGAGGTPPSIVDTGSPPSNPVDGQLWFDGGAGPPEIEVEWNGGEVTGNVTFLGDVDLSQANVIDGMGGGGGGTPPAMINYGSTAPNNPAEGQLWFDTSEESSVEQRLNDLEQRLAMIESQLASC